MLIASSRSNPTGNSVPWEIGRNIRNSLTFFIEFTSVCILQFLSFQKIHALPTVKPRGRIMVIWGILVP